MAERIYVMKDAGNLEPLTERPFDTEDILQALIADHPELLDGEQIRPADPRRWLLVTREKGIADVPDAGNRWSVDHLMIDQDAVPTFVEVKRSSNSEIRRSVVGQMLDYAAHATKTMGMAAIRRQFEAGRGDDADEVLRGFLQPDAGVALEAVVEGFWERLATNLAAKRVRLLFVADRIPDELARVVEFLNEQMPGIEVLAVEIKQFRGANQRTLVPQVIGRTVAPDPLIAAAEERGAVVNRKESGLTIGVQSTLRGPPLTVAWLFPTMSSYWNNLKGFTLGQVNWVELPEEAQVEFDELYRQMSRDGFAEEVGNDKAGGARGWAVDPAVAAQHVGPLKERLARAIAILKSL